MHGHRAVVRCLRQLARYVPRVSHAARTRLTPAASLRAAPGLINDGFHMMFNCIALSITLVAMVLARKGPTFGYTYGYDRHEVVAAFSNSMFLLFVRARRRWGWELGLPCVCCACVCGAWPVIRGLRCAGLGHERMLCAAPSADACHSNTRCVGFPLQVSCFLVLESLHRVVNPVTISGARLIEVGVLGLAVNLIGAVAFKTNNSWMGRMARHTTNAGMCTPHSCVPVCHAAAARRRRQVALRDPSASSVYAP